MAKVKMTVGGRSVERRSLVAAAVQIVDEKVQTSFELATLRARHASEKGSLPRGVARRIMTTANDWIDFVASGNVGMEDLFDMDDLANKENKDQRSVRVVAATRRVRWR